MGDDGQIYQFIVYPDLIGPNRFTRFTWSISANAGSFLLCYLIIYYALVCWY